MHDRGLPRFFLPLVLAAFLGTAGSPVYASDAGSSAPSGAAPEWSEDEYWAAAYGGDVETSLRILEDGVVRGVPFARCVKAELLFAGGLGKSDYAKVAELLNSLAFEDCIIKPFLLALMYREGRGLEQDTRMATHYFRKEAIFFWVKGFPDFYESIGLGEHPSPRPDLRRAEGWWREVEVKWSADEQYELALAYLNGDGVPKDSDIGYRILHLAASNGSAKAHERLQAVIDRGESSAYVPDGDSYMVRRAARMRPSDRFPTSPDRRGIGLRYLNGESGAGREPAKAYIWLLAAEAAGATDVAPALRKLEKELPPEVVRWARDWVRKGWWP